MDLTLFFRVVRRFRFLVVFGVLLAALVALLAYARVEFVNGAPKLTPRQEEVWQSDAVLFITQPGVKWVRTDSDTIGFSQLAVLYAVLVRSDEVRDLMRQEGEYRGEISARALTDEDRNGLPMVSVVATATSPTDAEVTVRLATKAFRQFIVEQQRQTSVPPARRVTVDVLQDVSPAGLLEPRKKTLSIFAFMTVMIAVFGLILVLENARPSVRRHTAHDDGPPSSRSIAMTVSPPHQGEDDEPRSRQSA